LTSENGTTLVISLVALVVVSILMAGIYSVTRAMVRESVYQMKLAQAQAIAEAGLEDALLQLRLNPDWRTGFTNKTFGSGAYTVTVSTDTAPWITSKGSSGSIALLGPAHATVRAQAQVATVCLNLSGSSKLSISAAVDAYDSSVNTSPTTFSFGANVCSNDKIQIQKNQGYAVNGDAYYFQGPAPDNTTVLGTIYQSTFTRTVPSHDGSAFVTSNNNLTGISPITYYNAGTKQLTIPAGFTVTLAPGNYYLNGLTVNSGATLVANNAAGPVTIYLNGDLDLDGAFTNSTRIPSKLLIYPQGNNNVNLQASSGSFLGVVEGPNSSIFTSEIVYGKLAGGSLNITNNFHYDLQFGGSANTQHVTWQIGSWSISP
jgi:Tfp pilus assembly protein PilX